MRKNQNKLQQIFKFSTLYFVFLRYRSVMDVPEGVFHGQLDRFNGITVMSNDEYKPDIDFAEKLKSKYIIKETKKPKLILCFFFFQNR